LSQALDDDLVAPGEQPILALALAQEVIDRALRALFRRHVATPSVVVPDDAAARMEHRPHAERVGHDILARMAAVDIGEVMAPPFRRQPRERLPRCALDLFDAIAEGREIAVKALLDPGGLSGHVVSSATERVDAGDGRAGEEIEKEDRRAPFPG